MADPLTLTEVVAVLGGLVTVGATAWLKYINDRLGRLETTQRQDAEAARVEMRGVRQDATARADKIWQTLEDIRKTQISGQERAEDQRTTMASTMATKDDLHREIDKLAGMIHKHGKTGVD